MNHRYEFAVSLGITKSNRERKGWFQSLFFDFDNFDFLGINFETNLKPYMEKLISDDIKLQWEAVIDIRNAIIGSRRQKANFIVMGKVYSLATVFLGVFEGSCRT